jgi:uncharacterized protein YgiM (DUF1202 family)
MGVEMRGKRFYIPLIALFLSVLACGRPVTTTLPAVGATAAPARLETILPPTKQARVITTGSNPTLSPTPAARCVVSTGLEKGTVNIRSGPGMSYTVVDYATEGEELMTIGEPVDGWQRVCNARLVEGWFYVERWCK